MGRVCSVCAHRRRKAIDKELTGEGAAWRSLREIGARHGLGKDALLRHYRKHLAAEIPRQEGDRP